MTFISDVIDKIKFSNLTTKPDIKECPFCLSEAYVAEEDRDFQGVYYFVVCQNCYCRTGLYLTPKNAINIWNTRPDKKIANI